MRNFWCEINIDRLEHNINRIREKSGKKLMAVVKANGYGLGVSTMSLLLENIVDGFAVSNIEEALQIGSSKDILILYPELADEDIPLIKNNFILTVDNLNTVEKLSLTGNAFRVHLYVNTGMNRFGIDPEEVDAFIQCIEEKYKNIIIDGIYTHLHNTGDPEYTKKQIDSFRSIAERHREVIPKIHILNTNGFLKYNEYVAFDNWLRLGNLIYGYNSSGYGYKKIFSYKARAIRVYGLQKGNSLGYGNSYRAKKDMRVGILDLGFIDKYGCVLDNKGNILRDIAKVFYHHLSYNSGISSEGKQARVLGKPNMNFTLIDMTEYKEDTIFTIDLPSVIADSSIPKRYRKGEEYVSI